MSASNWHGWKRAVMPLMTGTVDARAYALTSSWLRVTDHHGVDHFREHASGVFDGFSAPHLGVLGSQVDGVSSELVHSRLERHPGARRTEPEDHGERLAGERRPRFARGVETLQFRAAQQDPAEFFGTEIPKRQEVSRLHGLMPSP